MEIILQSRQTGKTTRMVKLASEKGYTIIVSRPSRVGAVLKLAEKLGLKIKEPIAYEEYLRYEIGQHKGTELIIDDAECILSHLFKYSSIKTIVMSDPDV